MTTNHAAHASRAAETSVALHSLIAERWSPRGFDASHRLADGQVEALLEAARWSPSASNTQPWRFLVAHRGEVAHQVLLDSLAPGNLTWAHAASALVLVAAQTVDPEGATLPWAVYDTGQAVAWMTAQAQAEGVALHQMGGFDKGAVRSALELAEDIEPLVVIAVGAPDAGAELPEHLARLESGPRSRRPLEDLLLDTPAVAEHRAA